MRAINLMPAQPRGQVLGASVSGPFAGLCGGLALVLVGTGLYVVEHNRVDARQAAVNDLTSSVAHWASVAQRYAHFSTEARQHDKRLEVIDSLIASRFDWSNLLTQLAREMPHGAVLSSLQAASPLSVGATSAPSITLSGCATSQPTVAQTMVQLRRVSGIASVVLSSSSASSSSSTSSSTSSGGCNLPVQFGMTLNFANEAGAIAGVGTSTTSSATS